MDIASAAQVEDIFQALLDYLIEPVLPLKSTSHPDLSLQQSIAKQMHAVVLLYNYYHRRQFPHLEFLDFESLCKVAVNAKPNLLVHLNYMKNCSVDGLYNNLSVTEKAIMDACNISIGINTLEDSPSMEGWPISNIAIFLTDSVKKNCFIQYGTTTQGVWSLIEKSYGEYGNGLQGMFGTKEKTDTKWPARVLKPDEAHLRQFAVSAVQETTGICPNELTILESHVTYSLSEKKSIARLFIMKCNSVNDSVFEVPIQEAIESLQGPLVKKSCNTYIVADAVEHFHLLPYAGMITNWFSREMLANTSVLVNELNISKNFSGKNDECLVSTGKSEESFGNHQGADFPVFKTNNPGVLNKKENGSSQVRRHQNSNEGRSLLLHLREERNNALEVLDNAVTKFSTECDSRSTKNGSDVKKWGETEDIRAEVLSRRNALLGQSRKRQRVCVDNVNSDIDVDTCKISGGNMFMINDDVGRLGHSPTINNSVKSSVGGCGRLDSFPVVEDHQFISERIGVQVDFNGDGALIVHASEEDVENAVIPQSMPDSIVFVGPVCFSQKYVDLYKRIVTKFGDVIMLESKEVSLCSDMVSTAMKGLFEVVDSMLQASSGAVDMGVLESWEMKLRFCEFSGLKVSWLRDHFEKMRKIPVVRELEGHAAVLEKCLEAKRKRAADLSKELELVCAEEKELTEKKMVVDADIEAARAKQECFSLNLF